MILQIDALEKLMRQGDYVNISPDGTVTVAERNGLRAELEERRQEVHELTDALSGLRALLDTPETKNFDKAVPLEAAHQVKRWGSEHDAGKQPEDWFWLLGYLAGKALAAVKAGDMEKAKHHCISSAAALRNWHAHIRSGQTVMRPGIAKEREP